MDPTQADPATQDQDPAHLPAGEGAESEVTQQTPGDTAEVRSQEEGHAPETASDDASQETKDPLILAQLETTQDEEPAKPAPPAAKPTAAPPKSAAQPAKPAEKQQVKPPSEPAEDDSNANLPDEDWQKLSHKSKSQFLSQRKTISRLKQESQAKAKEAEAARQEAELHERQFRDSGLSPEDYHNGVNVVAAVTRGDPSALPVLEASLKNLRQRLGIKDAPPPAPAPIAPAIDPDEVLRLVEEAEGSLDFTKLRELSAKLKNAKQTPPPPAAPPAQPAAAPTPAPAAGAPQRTASPDAEMTANTAVADYLVGEGVQQDRLLPYVRELIQDIKAKATREGRQMPGVQERLREVMAAHRARQVRAQQPPPKPATQPLSGRGRPVVTSRPATSTNADPLKHALPAGR